MSGPWYQPSPFATSHYTKEVELHDIQRQCEVPVSVTYPAPTNTQLKSHPDSVQFPVIVFSPLALGGKDCYQNIARSFALHGYIVITVSHQDNLKRQRKTKGMGWLVVSGVRKAIADCYNSPQMIVDRICDVIFVIESLRQIELSIVHLRNHIAFDRVIVMGHSFGALTAMLGAGARISIPAEAVATLHGPCAPETHRLADGRVQYSWSVPQVKAAVILSPIGPDYLGMEEDSFTFRVPCLFITGNKDHSFEMEHKSDWKRRVFELAVGDHPHCLVNFHDSDHGFGDLAGSMIVSTMAGWKSSRDLQSAVFRTSLAWVDGHVNRSDDALEWLRNANHIYQDKKLGFVEHSVPQAHRPPVAPPPSHHDLPTPTSFAFSVPSSYQNPPPTNPPYNEQPSPASSSAVGGYASLRQEMIYQSMSSAASSSVMEAPRQSQGSYSPAYLSNVPPSTSAPVSVSAPPQRGYNASLDDYALHVSACTIPKSDEGQSSDSSKQNLPAYLRS